MEDITFFRRDKLGCIMCLSQNAPLADILTADGATLKLDNQKNKHKKYVLTSRPLATQSTAQDVHWKSATNT